MITLKQFRIFGLADEFASAAKINKYVPRSVLIVSAVLAPVATIAAYGLLHLVKLDPKFS